MFRKFLKKDGKYDYVFLFCAAILAVFGLLMLSSASSDLGKLKFNDTYFYLKRQIIYGLIPGIIGFLAVNFLGYKKIKKYSFAILILNILFLILVFTSFGASYKGSSRWLNIFGFSVQPAEFLKISFIAYLAAWLSNKKMKRQTSFLRGIVPFLAISLIIAGLIFLQPATTIIIIIMGAAFIVYFASGMKIRHLAGIIFLGLLAVSVLIYSSDYRYKRVVAFLSDKPDARAEGYQLDQSLKAIGSGGLWGIGFGKSTLKYKYLPEPIGDSIFAVIAEELGFVGTIFFIGTFMTFLLRGFFLAKNAPDEFSKLAATGFISIFALQTFIHIAAVSGLTPLTGVPLPFVSYGGTSLAVFLTMTGILVNISKYS